MRICSLHPAATETVFALGLGDELVGRSQRCDHPPEARAVQVVTLDRGPGDERANPGSASWVRHLAHGGGPRWVDVEALAALDPDLILSQDDCPACATVGRSVDAAVELLGDDVSVVRMSVRTVEGAFNAITTVGAFTEAEDEAIGLVELLRERLGAIENRVLERRLDGVPAPRVVVLAWLDPPFVSGGWVPELVRRAGGWDVLGRDGEPPVATSWDRVRDVDPEHIILAPVGLDARGAVAALERAPLPTWFRTLDAVRDGGLWAIDAALAWRPGPRLVDAVGLMAERFDPEGLDGAGPGDGWVPLGVTGIRVGPLG